MPKCAKCDKEFKNDFALKIHVGRMHGEKAKAGLKKAKPVAEDAKGAFACEACGRTFKLPAHLARHASVAHAKAGKVKKARKVGRPAGRGAVAIAPVGLAQIPVSILQAELQRRAKKASKKLRKLLRQRAKLDVQITELEVLAGGTPRAVMKAAPKAKRGRKPGRKPQAQRAVGKPLAQYVAQVLAVASKELGIKEIEKKVLQAGYTTKAATIYKPIMKVLGKGGFKKIRRGVYTMKKTGGVAKVEVAGKPKTKRKRGTFAQTASEFVLGLAKGKGATTARINDAWKAMGRGGNADNTLSRLVHAGKLKREKLATGKGSTYTRT